MPTLLSPTPALIHAAATDAGNRSCFGPHFAGLGAADAQPWSRADFNAAVREQNRLLHAAGFRRPNEYARKIRKLSESRRGVAQSRPVTGRDFVKVR